MSYINVIADGVLAKRQVSTMREFDYEAFNEQQAALADMDEANHKRVQEKADAWKRSQKRKAKKLQSEYNLLMDEWLYRNNPKFDTTESLVARISEVETEMSKLF